MQIINKIGEYVGRLGLEVQQIECANCMKFVQLAQKKCTRDVLDSLVTL